MPSHEYSPGEALARLLAKLEPHGPLADRIRAAIDAGTDKEERQVARGRGRGKRGRVYRKHVPYSDTEALGVALSLLRAHFFEFPHVVNAVADEFKETRIGSGEREARRRSASTPLAQVALLGEDKTFEIEIETEATLVKTGTATQHLKRYEPASIEEVGKRIEALHEGQEQGRS